MIIIFKFEDYLGGGETLVTRFSQFLIEKYIPFFIFCKKNSYIHKGLEELNISQGHYCALTEDSNYYYLNKREREKLLSRILNELPSAEEYHFLTSSMRDVYMVADLCKKVKASCTHLILHNQDHRYVCRSVIDIIKEKIGYKKGFHNPKTLHFNKKMIDLLNKNLGLVPMSDIIVQLWKSDLGIVISRDKIVSLPSFRGCSPKIVDNDHSILWIGRLVDFKFASLFAMLNFIKGNGNYTLSIVGDGDRKKLYDYLKEANIPENRIKLLGEVPYKDLPDIIRTHSIGYAAGTSIIEIAQQGRPVIMALQNNKGERFKRDICGGVFYNTSKGNLGEDLCIKDESEITTLISDAILEIEEDYTMAAQKCFDYVNKEYNQDKNFSEYINIINHTALLNVNSIEVPTCGYFRRLLYKLKVT